MSAPDTSRPASMLAHVWKPGRRGHAAAAPVRISERALAIVQLTARRGAAERLAAATAGPLGLALPAMGSAAASGERFAIAIQPGSWLIGESWRAGGTLLAAVEKSTQGLGAVVDQTGGKTTVRIAGPHARDVLEKLCRIDLHPRVFKPGMAAVTPLGHINGIVVKVGDEPAYDLILPATFAETVLESIEAAADEFGILFEG